jgi:hypothetical protein
MFKASRATRANVLAWSFVTWQLVFGRLGAFYRGTRGYKAH